MQCTVCLSALYCVSQCNALCDSVQCTACPSAIHCMSQCSALCPCAVHFVSQCNGCLLSIDCCVLSLVCAQKWNRLVSSSRVVLLGNFSAQRAVTHSSHTPVIVAMASNTLGTWAIVELYSPVEFSVTTAPFSYCRGLMGSPSPPSMGYTLFIIIINNNKTCMD